MRLFVELLPERAQAAYDVRGDTRFLDDSGLWAKGPDAFRVVAQTFEADWRTRNRVSLAIGRCPPGTRVIVALRDVGGAIHVGAVRYVGGEGENAVGKLMRTSPADLEGTAEEISDAWWGFLVAKSVMEP